MAGDFRFGTEQKEIVRFLYTTVDSFVQDRLINKEQRIQHKEQCAERLAAEDGSCDKNTEVRYSDQAVLANLDWGIEALEEAINTANMETKLARLDHAEKMLQVCAMLNSDQRTAGVPNFYLSAWAHLNLSYLWKLRNDVRNSVFHVLEMFIVDPFFSRIDFAPELWKQLFLPHMSSIVGWYSEARQRLMIELVPDSSDLSFTADLDQFFNESLIYSMGPDQVEKLQKLEQLYGESLDDNTRLFAKFYEDCASSDSTTISKKMIPMFPIAEPPMTPLREVSRSIPDYVKFGPILPKSAGFSPVIQSKQDGRETSRSTSSPTLSHNIEESKEWDPQEAIHEENQDDSYGEPFDSNLDFEASCESGTPRSMKITENKENGASIKSSKANSQSHSPSTFSPVDSPRIFSPTVPSSNPDVHPKKGPAALLRLLSSHARDSTNAPSMLVSPRMNSYYSISSPDSDGEMIDLQKSVRRKTRSHARSMSFNKVDNQDLENSSLNGSDEGRSYISLPMSDKLTSRSRPPKDFVCPITGQLFNDPVTLETGQTYERKAIQEWLKRGNTTCPITRQPLSANSLPKTNYVLKRLITSWIEQHPDIAQEFLYSETPTNSFSSSSVKETSLVSYSSKMFRNPSNNCTPNHVYQRSKRFTQPALSTSPTSVISQATIEAIINGFKPYVSCLCTSENLEECEDAVLAIAKLWKDSKGDPGVHSYLSKPTIVNGFVEILSNSLNREVLRTSIYILSELIFSDETVAEILTSVDSDFDSLATLLKNGLAEAALLICQLRPTFAQLSAHNFIPSLVHLIQVRGEDLDDLHFVMDPKDAAILILEQILTGGDENSQSVNAFSFISANGVPALVKCLDRVEVRKFIISVLLCCMLADKCCRNYIASRIDMSHVLELFHSGNDNIRGICIDFLSELVQLNRRTVCNEILHRIRGEGSFSTMHTLLVYLHMAPMEQQPTIAALLLQLDLLAEPRKMSIYREEAVETLIEALHKKDFSNCQMMALDSLLSLSGTLTSSRRSYMEARLLKIAGFDQPYNALMKTGRREGENDLAETMDDEEKARNSWETKVAFVLCNHEKGSIFKALEECFKSNSLEMAKLCLVISTWLIYMLSVLPDTGIREVARKSLLGEFINVLQSSRNMEERILAALALRTFVLDPVEELEKYAKCIYRTLRKFKRTSPVITDILKSLMNLPCVNATELWNCTEIVELESSANGEVLSLLHLKGRVLSSHSDGTIKVWDAGKGVLRLIQEVREHSKAVTCLYVPSSGDKLYSGSLDKTIRVWAINPEEIHCVQVHDVKEVVHELTANAKLACYISSGTGVKVYNWSGVPKHVNFNKTVKCLATTGDKLYCGSSGYTIQEVDLHKLTSTTFYSGTRKLLGKQTINSLYVHDDLLFAGGSTSDGTAGKVFSLSTRTVVRSFSTGFDILRIAANNDFIFAATKCGMIEVWLKERVTRVASTKMNGGGHTKITSLTTDMEGRMLCAGSSDGKIQVWGID